MRKILTALLCSIVFVAGVNYQAIADYAATAGSGLTFGSVDLAGIKFPAFLVCDFTTAKQCAAVKAASTAAVAADPALVMRVADGGDVSLGAKADAHSCSSASAIACLGQLDDDVKTGAAATGAAVPAGAIYEAGLASSTEPTKATTGNLTGVRLDLAGSLVTAPYANRENLLQCAVTITASTAATTCTGMGAQGASVKIYITDLCVTRNDAATTADVFTLNDGATTIIDLPNNGGGGGFCKTYNTPLVVAANTAFQGTSGTSISSIHMSATGFKGY